MSLDATKRMCYIYLLLYLIFIIRYQCHTGELKFIEKMSYAKSYTIDVLYILTNENRFVFISQYVFFSSFFFIYIVLKIVVLFSNGRKQTTFLFDNKDEKKEFVKSMYCK